MHLQRMSSRKVCYSFVFLQVFIYYDDGGRKGWTATSDESEHIFNVLIIGASSQHVTNWYTTHGIWVQKHDRSQCIPILVRLTSSINERTAV